MSSNILLNCFMLLICHTKMMIIIIIIITIQIIFASDSIYFTIRQISDKFTYFFTVRQDYLFEPRHEKTNILVSDLVRHKQGCT